MADVPLVARVVEVIADHGPSAAGRYRYGSGCIVRERTVLTAAHVVAGAVAVTVRDAAKREYAATIDPRFVTDVRSPEPDLALIQVDDPRFEPNLPPVGLAQVNRDSPTGEPVSGCHAVGYPWFAETPSPTAIRDSVDALGVVPVLSKLARGLLSVQVSSSPRTLPPGEIPLGESEWSGMSGAPVLADGLLLGVVIEHAPREGQSAITAVPLTALEADPRYPAWGPGVSDPAAWWSRLGVSGRADLRLLPAGPSRPAPPAYREKMRDLGWTLHQRMPQLLGRQQEISDIAAFATGSAGYRWLVGGTFAGKTALLYEAVTVGLPSHVDVVCYFLSRRASDADSSHFLSAVVPQLAFLCDRDPPTVDRDREVSRLWREAADRAATAGRHLLLVVDGLDEDVRVPGLPSVASLLPAVAGGNAHVLVSSRPRPDLPVDVDDGHPLRTTVPVELEPFEGAADLVSRARLEIHELTHGPDAALAIDVLGLITAAAGPVSVADLATLLSPELAALPWQVRRFVEERAARSLEPVGPAEPLRYQFSHSSLLEHARADADLGRAEYVSRIRAWAAQWAAAGWQAPDTGESPPRYLLDAYPATLSSDPALLATLVSDVAWVDAAIRVSGVDAVLAHLGTVRSAVGDAGVSAMLAAVRGQARNLRPPLLAREQAYVLRQLCLQAAELGDERLAEESRVRLRGLADPGPVLISTTRRVSRALSAELAGHKGGTRALTVLPDGRMVSGGMDGWIRIWNLASGAPERVDLGRHDGDVTSVAVLPDGRLISSGMDGRVLVWDPAASSAEPVKLGGQYDVVLAIAVAPGGQVVAGGRDGRVLMWPAARPGTKPAELGRHGGAVHAVAVLPGGQVVSGGRDRCVRVWDLASPPSRPGELGRHGGAVHALAVLAGGRVVSAGDDGRILTWDPAGDPADPTEIGRHFSPVQAVGVTRAGRVICGGRDRRVRIWNPALPGSASVELGRHDGAVTAVAVTHGGLAVSCGAEGRVRVWDPAAPGAERGGSGRHDQRITALAVAQDGRVITGGRNGQVLVWDPSASRSWPAELSRPAVAVRAVAVLPDGRVACGYQDRLVLVWDPANPGARPAELGRHGSAALAALPDGRLMSGGHDGRVLVWDPDRPAADPAELVRHPGAVAALAALPGMRVVSCATEGPMLVWNLATGTGPAQLGGDAGHLVTTAAALPDGNLVTGGIDGRVLHWDLASPDARPAQAGSHHGWVTAVVALRDGRMVSSGTDELVRVWGPQGQAAHATIACSVQTLAAGPSPAGGDLIALAHRGGGMSMWSLPLRARVPGSPTSAHGTDAHAAGCQGSHPAG